MQIVDVAEIEQIVRDQLIIALHVGITLATGEFVRIVEEAEVRDQIGIGLGCIAHPDPDPLVALDRRIALDAGARLLAVIVMRRLDTGTAAVEAQPVIAALQRIADALAHRQRHEPVRAAIEDCRRLPSALRNMTICSLQILRLTIGASSSEALAATYQAFLRKGMAVEILQ